MRFSCLLLAAIVTLGGGASPCGALWEISGEGRWPDSWPEELEPLRAQSDTLSHISCDVHEIPFADREQLERALPYFLAIASEGTPLTLARGKNPWTGMTFGLTKRRLLEALGKGGQPAEDFAAGVAVITPKTGGLLAADADGSVAYIAAGAEESHPDATILRVGPPWPDDIRDERGALPEYVVPDGAKWLPIRRQDIRDPRFRKQSSYIQRVPIEVCLMVDGRVVDLNRIRLPQLVVDKRFDEKDEAAEQDK